MIFFFYSYILINIVILIFSLFVYESRGEQDNVTNGSVRLTFPTSQCNMKVPCLPRTLLAMIQ